MKFCLFPERILILNVLCLMLQDLLGEVRACCSLKLPAEFWRLCKRTEHFAGLTQHKGGEIISLLMNVFRHILRRWIDVKKKWRGSMVIMCFAVWRTFQVKNINTLSPPQACEGIVEQGTCTNTKCPEEWAITVSYSRWETLCVFSQ